MHFSLRVTLHLEQEIPMKQIHTPFKVWALTFFHPPLLSKPWLVVPVVKTHNLVAVAAFLLSVVLITYFKIRLPSPQPLVFSDGCQWNQDVSYPEPATPWRVRGKAFVFLSFFGSIFSEATSSKFSSLAFKILSRINSQAIFSWELNASLCSLLHDLMARSYPSGVSTRPQKCPAQTYRPSWAW